MANGRMITKDITGDKRINQLSSDTSRLAFTWLVTFCDREGRTHGDPAMVRSMLFPRRQDVSIEDMEEIIKEWACLGLIIWYEVDDDLWIWFPGFDKNQPGLRKDKEAPSKIPEPSPEGIELVRSKYGVGTDKVPVKRKEENGIEKNGEEEKDSPPPAILNDDPTCVRIYLAITGQIAVPSDTKQNVIDAVRAIMAVNNNDANRTIMYLQPYWDEWRNRKYVASNTAWLTEWAVSCEIPARKNGKTPAPEVDTMAEYERVKQETRAKLRAAKAANHAENE